MGGLVDVAEQARLGDFADDYLQAETMKASVWSAMMPAGTGKRLRKAKNPSLRLSVYWEQPTPGQAGENRCVDTAVLDPRLGDQMHLPRVGDDQPADIGRDSFEIA